MEQKLFILSDFDIYTEYAVFPDPLSPIKKYLSGLQISSTISSTKNIFSNRSVSSFPAM